MIMQCADPSAVCSDPLNDVLMYEELNDEMNELRAQKTETSLHCGHDETVTEAQQDDDTTPADEPVA